MKRGNSRIYQQAAEFFKKSIDRTEAFILKSRRSLTRKCFRKWWDLFRLNNRHSHGNLTGELNSAKPLNKNLMYFLSPPSLLRRRPENLEFVFKIPRETDGRATRVGLALVSRLANLAHFKTHMALRLFLLLGLYSWLLRSFDLICTGDPLKHTRFQRF